MQAIADKKKKPELPSWDNELFRDLPERIASRSPPHIVHSELAKLMMWKLARGQSRPLQKLVESNAPKEVETASAAALQQLADGNWEAAFNKLTELKGVGVATASALLAAVAPQLCPFMADEVIESATTGKRDYNMATYKRMRTTLVSKAAALGEGWSAEKAGKALWAAAVLGPGEEEKEQEADREPAGKRRRKV